MALEDISFDSPYLIDDYYMNNYIADNIFKLIQEKTNSENQLLLLQDSISKIKMALENESEDDIYLIDELLLPNYATDSGYLSDSAEISSKIFLLSQEKIIQETNLQSLITHIPSNSALIGEITSSQTDPKTIKFALQGFIFGMILSIVLALIIGKFKAYKEENAITL